MLAAATDLFTHLEFLRQAEAVSGADDGARSRDPIADRRTRISADFWKSMPEFHFVRQSSAIRAGSIGQQTGQERAHKG